MQRSIRSCASLRRSISALDDRRLIEGCQRNDPAYWDALVHRYEQTIYKFAYVFCRNHEDSADISATVFVRLYLSIHNFRFESSFSAWVFRMVRNVYIDTCVRAPYRTHEMLECGCDSDGDLPGYEIADSNPFPDDLVVQRECKRVLEDAISHLPGYQRAMMDLYHNEGRSYEEIASSTGLSIGTVKSRLSRARSMLKQRLTIHTELLVG